MLVCQYHMGHSSEPNCVKGKKIHVWANGDIYNNVYVVNINPNRLRTWNSILLHITSKINPSFGAVRNLVSVKTKEVINCFADLENHEIYIAAGLAPIQFERYKIVVKNDYKARKKHTKKFYSGDIDSSKKNFWCETKRRKRTVIFVLVNGRLCQSPTKLVLTETDMEMWDVVLEYLSNVLDVPDGIRDLYTIFGDIIYNPVEIQHGYLYVVVPHNERFIQMDYVGMFNEWEARRRNGIQQSIRPAGSPVPVRKSGGQRSNVKQQDLETLKASSTKDTLAKRGNEKKRSKSKASSGIKRGSRKASSQTSPVSEEISVGPTSILDDIPLTHAINVEPTSMLDAIPLTDSMSLDSLNEVECVTNIRGYCIYISDPACICEKQDISSNIKGTEPLKIGDEGDGGEIVEKDDEISEKNYSKARVDDIFCIGKARGCCKYSLDPECTCETSSETSSEDKIIILENKVSDNMFDLVDSIDGEDNDSIENLTQSAFENKFVVDNEVFENVTEPAKSDDEVDGGIAEDNVQENDMNDMNVSTLSTEDENSPENVQENDISENNVSEPSTDDENSPENFNKPDSILSEPGPILETSQKSNEILENMNEDSKDKLNDTDIHEVIPVTDEYGDARDIKSTEYSLTNGPNCEICTEPVTVEDNKCCTVNEHCSQFKYVSEIYDKNKPEDLNTLLGNIEQDVNNKSSIDISEPAEAENNNDDENNSSEKLNKKKIINGGITAALSEGVLSAKDNPPHTRSRTSISFNELAKLKMGTQNQQDEVKQDEIKQDEVKQDDIKQDDIKQDVVKQDEVKQYVVKQEVVKQDEIINGGVTAALSEGVLSARDNPPHTPSRTSICFSDLAKSNSGIQNQQVQVEQGEVKQDEVKQDEATQDEVTQDEATQEEVNQKSYANKQISAISSVDATSVQTDRRNSKVCSCRPQGRVGSLNQIYIGYYPPYCMAPDVYCKCSQHSTDSTEENESDSTHKAKY